MSVSDYEYAVYAGEFHQEVRLSDEALNEISLHASCPLLDECADCGATDEPLSDGYCQSCWRGMRTQ
jgi:hypothetical protein